MLTLARTSAYQDVPSVVGNCCLQPSLCAPAAASTLSHQHLAHTFLTLVGMSPIPLAAYWQVRKADPFIQLKLRAVGTTASGRPDEKS